MPTEVKLPQFSMGMSAATIVKWLKQVGDRVEMDDPLVEIEAEKANIEVVSPASGTLCEIVVPEGASVPVYDVMAFIDEN